MIIYEFLLLLLTGSLAGCSGPVETNTLPAFTVTVEAEPVITMPIVTETVTETNVVEAAATIVNTDNEIRFCSPIKGMKKEDLKAAVITPYLPPPAGSDNPHHGVDLADKDPNTGFALDGREVDALLSGQVVTVISNRFPYGNAIIIGTQLINLPESLPAELRLSEISPVDISHSALTCPPVESIEVSNRLEDQTIYILYAHLQDEPILKVGDYVECGEEVGRIGSTGNSINPHLHLEIRTGMSSFPPGSMSHYDDSATVEEMKNYCLWRISGYYQRLDPIKLLDRVSQDN